MSNACSYCYYSAEGYCTTCGAQWVHTGDAYCGACFGSCGAFRGDPVIESDEDG